MIVDWIDKTEIRVTGTKVELVAAFDVLRALYDLPGVDTPTLTRADLSMMATGEQVEAGGFFDDEQYRRMIWTRLPSGRWMTGNEESVGGHSGVSSGWLAGARRPTRIEAKP